MEEFNRLPEMPALLRKAMEQVIVKACFDIQAQAMSNAPVDTGMLESSIYTVTAKGSSYGDGVVDPSKLLPEVDAPPNSLTAYVVVGANYGLYVEYGTEHGPAQPYLTPAAEFVRPQFEKAAHALERRMRELGGLEEI